MTSNCFKPTPSWPKGAFQATSAIMDRGNLYILIDEHLGVSLEDIQFNLAQNHWSENLNLINCSTCVSGGAGRRR